jgi:hypothetical protein
VRTKQVSRVQRRLHAAEETVKMSTGAAHVQPTGYSSGSRR